MNKCATLLFPTNKNQRFMNLTTSAWLTTATLFAAGHPLLAQTGAVQSRSGGNVVTNSPLKRIDAGVFEIGNVRLYRKLENWVKFEAFGIDPKNPDPGRVTVRAGTIRAGDEDHERRATGGRHQRYDP